MRNAALRRDQIAVLTHLHRGTSDGHSLARIDISPRIRQRKPAYRYLKRPEKSRAVQLPLPQPLIHITESPLDRRHRGNPTDPDATRSDFPGKSDVATCPTR